MNEKLHQLNKRYITLIGALSIFFVIGSTHTIPNYGPYLVSYFRYLSGDSG